MPGSSLVRHFNETQRDGQRLWWGRVEEDGIPYRGDAPPLMTEDEYEDRVVKVASFKNDYFDTADREQNALFRAVMECCVNGWFELVFIERFWQGTTKHYLEWTEFFKEDGSRAPFASSKPLEVDPGGHANLFDNPPPRRRTA